MPTPPAAAPTTGSRSTRTAAPGAARSGTTSATTPIRPRTTSSGSLAGTLDDQSRSANTTSPSAVGRSAGNPTKGNTRRAATPSGRTRLPSDRRRELGAEERPVVRLESGLPGGVERHQDLLVDRQLVQGTELRLVDRGVRHQGQQPRPGTARRPGPRPGACGPRATAAERSSRTPDQAQRHDRTRAHRGPGEQRRAGEAAGPRQAAPAPGRARPASGRARRRRPGRARRPRAAPRGTPTPARRGRAGSTRRRRR